MARALCNLTPRHHRAIALRLAGESPSSIATTLGVERRTVYAWFGSPLVKDELARQLAQLDELVIHQVANRALATAPASEAAM